MSDDLVNPRPVRSFSHRFSCSFNALVLSFSHGYFYQVGIKREAFQLRSSYHVVSLSYLHVNMVVISKRPSYTKNLVAGRDFSPDVLASVNSKVSY